ncbi:hypothetical protein MPSEU_001051400 [Mayamaea pseudoterrestris]|nr:hypothetical protein MPSEU_001051400 [Mayamaea pseudoterrestris]
MALNEALQQQMTSQPASRKSEETKVIACTSSSPTAGHFELQTRLPDGSSRIASEKERKAADMESKLAQVANHIANMSLEQKLDWAEKQRAYGNSLYEKQEYEQAMDVYLTLLPVAYEHDALFLKIMNNLAQAALSLNWYRKSIQFCSMALGRLKLDGKHVDISSETRAATTNRDTGSIDLDHLQVSKLYYRRSKSHRLSGEYATARHDLSQARKWLEQDKLTNGDDGEMTASFNNVHVDQTDELDDKHQDDTNLNSTLSPDMSGTGNKMNPSIASLNAALCREERLLRQAMTTAKLNDEQTKRAMQQLWSSPSTKRIGAMNALFDKNVSDNHNGATVLDQTTMRRRNLLSSSQQQATGISMHNHGDANDHTHKLQSYIDWYLHMVGRVAERLLVLLGDEEWVHERRRGRHEH